MTGFVDCHLHTEFSEDARMNLSWVLEHAGELGLTGVCPTEHFDPAPTDPRFFHTDIDGMLRRHRTVLETRPKVAIGVGLEITYRPGKEEHVRSLMAAHPFDLVIGAVHDIDGLYLREWLQHQPPQLPLRQRLDPFVALTAEMIRSRLFRVIGHIDYVKRYVPALTGDSLVAMFRTEFAEMLSVLVSNGGVLELNLAGLRHSLQEPYPSRALLALYRDMGGAAVTVGSDAHSPLHYRIPLGRGEEMARAAGLRVIDWRSVA